MKLLLFIVFLVIVKGEDTQQYDMSQYFTCEFLTPRKCQLENEEGIKAFLKSEFPNYPMLIHTNSDRAAFVFYNIVGEKLEEIPLYGLKQSQIENILDKRGFYNENPSQFKDFEELFTDEFVMGLVD